jgi:hypothetical protein
MGTHRRARLAVRRLRTGVLAVVIALALGGCGRAAAPLTPGDSGPGSTETGPSPSPPQRTPLSSGPTSTDPATDQIELVGRLEAGVERCIVLRTDDGKTYEMLNADPTTFVVGTRVRVRGVIRTDMMSFCMQGPIVEVSQIQPA